MTYLKNKLFRLFSGAFCITLIFIVITYGFSVVNYNTGTYGYGTYEPIASAEYDEGGLSLSLFGYEAVVPVEIGGISTDQLSWLYPLLPSQLRVARTIATALSWLFEPTAETQYYDSGVPKSVIGYSG